jgi:radical SAM superfamily enzyme YgiQ (UPF0313 family)
LPSIAAVLEKEGHTVKCIDLRECRDWDDARKRIVNDNADIFGVHMPTLDFYEAKKCGEIIKETGKPSIVGGPHPSICPDSVATDTCFDYVFVGEAEATLPKLIENPNSFGRIVVGEHPDLDSLPYEDREIFNLKKIFATKNTFFQNPLVSIISGRGCPYHCSFCKPGEDVIFGKFRMRSIEHLMGEIELLNKRYNYATLMIDDDSFTLDSSYVRHFCDCYGKIAKPFVCQSRADFIAENPDIIKRMSDVGLKMLIIGFESGNQRILNLLRKGTTVEQNYEAARVCRRYRVGIWANYMLGIPTETKDEMRDTINMIQRIKPEHPSPSFFTPINGTALYDYCKKNDLLVSDDPTVLGTRSPDQPKIKDIDYHWAYAHLPIARIQRIRKTLRPLKTVRNNLKNRF